MTIKRGISGLRGTIDADEERLDPTTVVRWVQGAVALLGAETRPLIALGRDARRSSPAIAALARGALLAAGATVVDLGLTLTPTLQHELRRDPRLDGGIMVTASHNPVEWNGLKFLDREGLFPAPDWWEALEARLHADRLPVVSLDRIGRVIERGEAAWQAHLGAVLDALPGERIRAARLRVALDACNGGAARWAELLDALGCETILLHGEQHGYFAREAEPLPRHLHALRALVRSAHADLGLAADPDGDRLVLVDSRGEPVSEEHTVVLVARALATGAEHLVVVNSVTTHAVEAAVAPARVLRSAVGERNVVAALLEHGGTVGGEGSGGIIIPAINLARDGMAAAGVILSLLARTGIPLHELVAAIPHWSGVKQRLAVEGGRPELLRELAARWRVSSPRLSLTPTRLALRGEGELELALDSDAGLALEATGPDGARLRATGDGGEARQLLERLAAAGDVPGVDLTDGIKVGRADVWLSLRPSNTEPIVRLMGEQRGGGS